MTIQPPSLDEVKKKAHAMKVDTIHIETTGDGETIVRAALYVGRKKVFSFPKGYSPSLFLDHNESRLFKIPKRRQLEDEAWREAPKGMMY